jgi:hypothetical protein
VSAEATFKCGDKVRFRGRAQTSTEPMVIKKIIGRDHYLDWDARPWLAANLISDAEWHEIHDDRPIYVKLGLPQVERNVPIPKDARSERPPTGRRTKPPSKWPAFLQNLKSGDSFVLAWPEAGTIRVHARKLGIKLKWKIEKPFSQEGMTTERFWRV